MVDLKYIKSINYFELSQMVINYYKEKNIDIKSHPDIIGPALVNTGNAYKGFWIKNSDTDKDEQVYISGEDIKEVLNFYLSSQGAEFIDVTYGSLVDIAYKKKKVMQDDINDQNIEKNKEIIQETELTENNSHEELARMARENRKFTILQRERDLNETQKAKNRSAIIAGICIIGAATSMYFNGQDLNAVIQQELNAIYSWEALAQYVQNLGPLTTLLSAGAGAFMARYMKNSRKFRQVQNDIIDFNASLENIQNLGGNEDVKSR